MIFEWLDRDSFWFNQKLTMYNYNNFISIGVYKFTDINVYRIVGKTVEGDIIFEEFPISNEVKYERYKKEFIEFMLNRPIESKLNDNKIKI